MVEPTVQLPSPSESSADIFGSRVCKHTPFLGLHPTGPLLFYSFTPSGACSSCEALVCIHFIQTNSFMLLYLIMFNHRIMFNHALESTDHTKQQNILNTMSLISSPFHWMIICVLADWPACQQVGRILRLFASLILIWCKIAFSTSCPL